MNRMRKHALTAGRALLAAAALAVCTTAPCRADNVYVGSEYQIASILGQGDGTRGQISVAAGNGAYLAVWRDHRSGGTSDDIYGTFVSLSGAPLGDESFLISSGASGEPISGPENYPSVAYNGTNFLVAWSGTVDGETFSRIFATRVTTSGQVLDPGGFEISQTYADYQWYPQVASNGVEWEIVWQKGGYATVPSVSAATVSAGGTVTKRITPTSASYDQRTPVIAWNGLSGTSARYFVAWEEESSDSNVRGCRLDNTGTKVSGSDVLVSNQAGAPGSGEVGNQFHPSVAGGKDSAGNLGGWMVAWEDARLLDSGSPTDVRATRITAAGAVQDPGGILVFDDYGEYHGDQTTYYATPEVGWNGTSYTALCRNNANSRRVYARTVGWNGTVGSSHQISTSSAGPTGMGIAGGLGDGGCMAVWEYSGSSNVAGCRVDLSGVGGTEHTLSLSKQIQQQYGAAFNGSRQVIVWSDKRGGKYNIYAARVRSNGALDDPLGVVVSPSGYDQKEPAIAWNSVNSCFLVVWRQGTSSGGEDDIHGIRLNSNLARIGTELAICSADFTQMTPAVAWNGSNWLVVWGDQRNDNITSDIYGVRVSGVGVVSTTTVYLSTASGDQIAPSVAAGSSGSWNVAWEDRATSPIRIKSRLVPNSGTIETEKTVSTRTPNMAAPKVAYDGTNYLIVWSESATSTYSIHGALMNSTNTRVTADPAGDIVVSTGATYRDGPSLTWTGSKYVVVWQDNRNMISTQTDIYCARVNTNGTVDDPSGVVVSQSARSESGPIVVPVTSTQCGAYYANSMYSINRLRGRVVWLTTPPPPEYDINDAKQLPEGTPVTLSDAVVTAGNNQLSGMFYVEDRSKLSGIKVVWAGSTVSEGNPVTVSGPVVTVGGERQITATSVTVEQWTPVVPVPLSMHVVDLGGVAAGIVPGIGSRGPNNIGLLVKIWGIVRNPAGGYFELEDASGVRARVKCPVTLPTSGLMYKVVGISSCEPIDVGYGSLLLVRKAGDIQSVP